MPAHPAQHKDQWHAVLVSQRLTAALVRHHGRLGDWIDEGIFFTFHRLGGMGQEMLVCPCVPGGSDQVRGTGGGGHGGRNGPGGAICPGYYREHDSHIPVRSGWSGHGATGSAAVEDRLLSDR